MQVLAVIARCYTYPEATTHFVGLLECNIGTAQHIFNTIDSFFVENRLSWTNCIAFESDNCAVMKGKHNGVIKLIRDKNKNVLDLGCIAHLTNLCLVAAKIGFPFKVDELLTDIYYHFEKSSKRTEALKGYFADFPDVEYHAVLRHCPTRWLSMRPCITRLIAHYEPLCSYFADHEESKVGKVRYIASILHDETTLPLLHFLEEVLKPVDAYNKLMQNEDFVLHMSYEASLSLVTDMLGKILPPTVI